MRREEQNSNDVPPTTASLTRKATWLVWSGVVNLANSVLLWMVMARWRDAAEVGRFTIAVSIYLVFVALCSLGLGPYLVSEITRRKEFGSAHHPFIASAAAFLFLCSLGFAVLMGATGSFVGDSAEVEITTALLSLALLPTGLIVTAEAVFIANGRTRVIALANTVENIFRTLVPLALVITGFRLWVIGSSFVVARLLACFVYAMAARGTLTSLWLAQRSEMAALAKVTPTFAGITILSSIHWQVAVLLLGRLGSEVATAHFGVASRFLVPVGVLLASYSSVIQPEATSRAAASRASLGAFLSQVMRFVMVFALPFAVGIGLVAREGLTELFGEEYGAAAVALALLGMSVVPQSLVMIVARGLVATGQQRIDLLGNLVGLLTCYSFGVLLIPRYGANGAAAAHLLSMIALASVELGFAVRQVFRIKIGKIIAVCFVPLSLMIVVVWHARVWGLWSAVLLGALVYFALLGLFQLHPKTEIRSI